MGCYCSEIAILKSDIGVIESSISKLHSINTNSSEILNKIKLCADKLGNNLDVTNKENIITLLSNLSKDEPGNIEKSASEWTNYKEDLKRKLESMEISDRNYHEEQRRSSSHND